MKKILLVAFLGCSFTVIAQQKVSTNIVCNGKTFNGDSSLVVVNDKIVGMMHEIKTQQYVDSLMKVKVAKIEVARNGTALFGEKARKGLILLTTK